MAIYVKNCYICVMGVERRTFERNFVWRIYTEPILNSFFYFLYKDNQVSKQFVCKIGHVFLLIRYEFLRENYDVLLTYFSCSLYVWCTLDNNRRTLNADWPIVSPQ